MTEQEQEDYIKTHYNEARALFREDITNLKNKGSFLMWKYALKEFQRNSKSTIVTEEVLKKYMENYNQE